LDLQLAAILMSKNQPEMDVLKFKLFEVQAATDELCSLSRA